jgi:hypothetical protein
MWKRKAVFEEFITNYLYKAENVLKILFTYLLDFCTSVAFTGPPLWSSGQGSWLQIRSPEFDSRHYQKKKVVGLEQGPLGLVSTTEELLDRKVAAPV